MKDLFKNPIFIGTAIVVGLIALYFFFKNMTGNATRKSLPNLGSQCSYLEDCCSSSSTIDSGCCTSFWNFCAGERTSPCQCLSNKQCGRDQSCVDCRCQSETNINRTDCPIGEVKNDKGECVCPDGQVRVLGKCVKRTPTIPQFRFTPPAPRRGFGAM